jgi:hypothetical protein
MYPGERYFLACGYRTVSIGYGAFEKLTRFFGGYRTCSLTALRFIGFKLECHALSKQFRNNIRNDESPTGGLQRR